MAATKYCIECVNLFICPRQNDYFDKVPADCLMYVDRLSQIPEDESEELYEN